MPSRPPHPCNKPGCGRLTVTAFCPDHQADADARERARLAALARRTDAVRPSSTARGYGTSRWQKARATYLSRPENALCRACKAKGHVTAAAVVDHRIPVRQAPDRFWDTTNWQPLCRPCHQAKTNREDGGFGRVPAQRTPTAG